MEFKRGSEDHCLLLCCTLSSAPVFRDLYPRGMYSGLSTPCKVTWTMHRHGQNTLRVIAA